MDKVSPYLHRLLQEERKTLLKSEICHGPQKN
jgi:hypothetical protein